MMDQSFDNGSDFTDIATVLRESEDGSGMYVSGLNKNLSDAFDNCLNNTGMKVYLRVRPIKAKEETTITVESDTSIVTTAPESSKRAQYTRTEARHYIFSRVFGANSTQDEVFEHTTAPLLKKFLSGENCVLFAYGMTNAGKTHTMQGSNSNPGILPKLVTSILEETAKYTTEWDLHVSMLEIYQENIYDLLSKKKKEKLSIRDANGKVEVNKLSAHSIKSTKEACKLMETAAYHRSKSSTFLNTGSSRSHAVYTITLDRSNEEGVFNQSVAFQLVDLAGAERGNRTKATAAQQKEANMINTSLMQLWRCLQGMKKKNADLGSSQEIIPFRESKLTHLLMPILNRAGMAGTAMIACVNPQVDDYDETISVLANASIATKITEISDVGRTAGHLQSEAALDKIAEKAAATAAAAQAALVLANAEKKRRRVESTAAAAAASNAPRGHRDSTCSVANPNPVSAAVGKMVRVVSGKAAAMSGSKRKADSDVTVDTLKTSTMDTEEQAEIQEELTQLRAEVERLTELNTKLELTHNRRELEIREEVAEEMKAYSADLMRQIRELQAKLNARDEASVTDVTRSVKKARKQQMRTIAEENQGRDVQEIEEEMERMKNQYEQEIATLKQQNIALAAAVEKFQSSVAPAGILPPASIGVQLATKINTFSTAVAGAVSSSSSSLQQNIDASTAQVAAEFNKRFSKKSNDENSVPANVAPITTTVAVEKASPLSKSPTSRSPNRSPLSEVRNAGNSPVLKSYQNGTISALAKRVDSPQRVREDTAGAASATGASGYSTRLRAQQIRG